MVDISRVRTVWSGFIGGPGVTTMYFFDTATAVASVHSFWTGIASMLPNDVHLQVENGGDVIDDATGDLVDSWTAEAVAAVNGTNDAVYSAPAGAVIDWLTSTIANHRRLRGRTFLVPLSSAAYQNDGSLSNTAREGFQTAADDLVAAQSASFCIWHRGTGDTGSSGLVTSAFVPDSSAVLRSRRD